MGRSSDRSWDPKSCTWESDSGPPSLGGGVVYCRDPAEGARRRTWMDDAGLLGAGGGLRVSPRLGWLSSLRVPFPGWVVEL